MTEETRNLLELQEREKFEFLKLTEAEQTKAQLRAFATYKANPWSFLRDCVQTRDQVDPELKIKPYPSYLEYLQFVTAAWSTYKLLAIPKSRRMTMSWTCIPLYLWEAIFRPGSDFAFVSKKQDDAGELIERAEFIFRQIPEWRIPKVLLPQLRNGRMTKDPPALIFEDTLSKLTGFPMGADQLRQFTFSGVFGDECAFWENAEDFYAATKPTIDGGGRMTLVSSRSPGFFKKIVFDKIDHPDYNFPEQAPAEVRHPLTGIECWRNPTNQFFIIDLHYTANPDKRSKEWLTGVRSSMPIRKFQQEYEKSWQNFAGLPVFADFSRGLHTARELDPEPGLPLLIGWDFGLTPAAVVCQLNGGSLRVLREFVATNEAISTFAPKVFQSLRISFGSLMQRPDETVRNWIDPAGFARSQSDARTCAEMLRKSGFSQIQGGPIGFEERKEAVEYFLTRHTKDGPGLLLSEKHCPVLLEGFAGGYQYPENATETEPAKLRPLKNAWSHSQDALQYVAAGAIQLKRTYNLHLEPPSYSFQREGASEAPKGNKDEYFRRR